MQGSVRGATANQVKQKDERRKEEKDGRRDGAKQQGYDGGRGGGGGVEFEGGERVEERSRGAEMDRRREQFRHLTS